MLPIRIRGWKSFAGWFVLPLDGLLRTISIAWSLDTRELGRHHWPGFLGATPTMPRRIIRLRSKHLMPRPSAAQLQLGTTRSFIEPRAKPLAKPKAVPGAITLAFTENTPSH